MKSSTKTTLIIIGIILAAFVLFVAMFASANNKAIFLEEQVKGALSNIEVAEKRRVDLVYNLVDATLAYQEYEGDTLIQITEARANAASGNVEAATTALNAVAEAYPELKANEQYKTLMNEMALTENQIAQYRNNYNEQVRAYNRCVRSFPNSLFLNLTGYERQNFEYLEYNAPADAPQDLFGNND